MPELDFHANTELASTSCWSSVPSAAGVGFRSRMAEFGGGGGGGGRGRTGSGVALGEWDLHERLRNAASQTE